MSINFLEGNQLKILKKPIVLRLSANWWLSATNWVPFQGPRSPLATFWPKWSPYKRSFFFKQRCKPLYFSCKFESLNKRPNERVRSPFCLEKVPFLGGENDFPFGSRFKEVRSPSILVALKATSRDRMTKLTIAMSSLTHFKHFDKINWVKLRLVQYFLDKCTDCILSRD